MSISTWKKEYYYGDINKRLVGMLPQNLNKHSVILSDGILIGYMGDSVMHKATLIPFIQSEIESFKQEAYLHFKKHNDPKLLIESLSPRSRIITKLYNFFGLRSITC